jgi:hypothetical protein
VEDHGCSVSLDGYATYYIELGKDAIGTVQGRALPLLRQHRECIVDANGYCLTRWGYTGVCEGLCGGKFVAGALCTCTADGSALRCEACESMAMCFPVAGSWMRTC